MYIVRIRVFFHFLSVYKWGMQNTLFINAPNNYISVRFIPFFPRSPLLYALALFSYPMSHFTVSGSGHLTCTSTGHFTVQEPTVVGVVGGGLGGGSGGGESGGGLSGCRRQPRLPRRVLVQ